MRVEPPCSSGNEIFQSLVIAEVRNQGDVQHSSQSGAGPGIGPTGGTWAGSLGSMDANYEPTHYHSEYGLW